MTRMRMKSGTNDLGDRRAWASTYAAALGWIRDTERLSLADKEAILAGTARRVLHIPMPES